MNCEHVNDPETCPYCKAEHGRCTMPNLHRALTDPRGIGLTDVLIGAEKDRPGSVRRQSGHDIWLERTTVGVA